MEIVIVYILSLWILSTIDYGNHQKFTLIQNDLMIRHVNAKYIQIHQIYAHNAMKLGKTMKMEPPRVPKGMC